VGAQEFRYRHAVSRIGLPSSAKIAQIFWVCTSVSNSSNEHTRESFCLIIFTQSLLWFSGVFLLLHFKEKSWSFKELDQTQFVVGLPTDKDVLQKMHLLLESFHKEDWLDHLPNFLGVSNSTMLPLSITRILSRSITVFNLCAITMSVVSLNSDLIVC